MSGNDQRVPRLEGELEKIYAQQMAMLAARCDAFYDGTVHEALSAAGILSALLSEQGQTSLLGQLGFKEKCKFLDSRHLNRLCLNSAKGSWPTTVMPFSVYTEKYLVDFDEWWGQEFQLWYSNIIVTREELVGAIRNKEANHVDPKTTKKIAAVRRSRSGWQRQITENEDGTTQMYVGVSLSRQPLPEDSKMEEISDYELASVIAIAEEVLFTLTPEPENRKRMHHPDLQKPYYLSMGESDIYKDKIRKYLVKLDEISDGKLSKMQESRIEMARKFINDALAIDCLNADQCRVSEAIAVHMKSVELPWSDL